MRPLVACAIALCAALPLHAQETYKWVDEKGVVNYSTTPPPAKKGSKPEVVEDRISVVPVDPDLERQGEAMRKREERRAKEEQAESQRRRQQAAAQPAYTPPAPEYPYSDDWWYGGGHDYYPSRPVRPTHPIAPRPPRPPASGNVPLRGTTPALLR